MNTTRTRQVSVAASMASLLAACAQPEPQLSTQQPLARVTPLALENGDSGTDPGRMCYVSTPDCMSLSDEPFAPCLLSTEPCPQKGEVILTPAPHDMRVVVVPGAPR